MAGGLPAVLGGQLSAGGAKDRCGWLRDKYGVSWQIIPSILGKLLGDKDPKKSKRVMEAMLQMDKIDIKQLKQAVGRRVIARRTGVLRGSF